MKQQVAIIGSGNWGSAIARIVGQNVKRLDNFEERVNMYVFEEMVDGQKLSEIINTQHENTKYLPGYKLPDNVVAVTDPLEAAKNADVLIWVLPHKFVRGACKPMIGKIKPGAVCLSLIKGFDILPNRGVALISQVIKETLGTEVSVMMGANLAGEVAAEKFCESTIGSRDKSVGDMLKNLMQTDYFRITVVDDIEAIEVCGALKNIVAVAAGFADGLALGDNTKAAIMRIGLMEMIEYARVFHSGAKMSTFFESCGVADLITTCYGGRNRRLSEAFVTTGKTMDQLEKEMLNGQRLQGPQTAEEVYIKLKSKDALAKFPLMVGVHRVCIGELKPGQIIDCIRNHPVHQSNL